MADNFNLAKFLRNNQLLNEGIGGYKDIVPYAGPEKKLDGFGDEFDQVDPVEEMDDSMTGDKGWQYDDEDGIDDPDADIVNDFVQGMRPYYEKDPSFIKRVIDALRGKGFGAKMYDAGFRMNENKDDIDYADYGVDPNDPDADIIVSFMQDMRDINNMKDPSFIDNFKDWLKGIKSDYQFNKRFKKSPFKMNEAEEEDAYFDYKNNRRSFLPSPDEFQGALDSSEMSQQDFMMSLAHKDFDGDVSAIVKKTIDGLRAGGFDDQDIIDFLATDFSLDEEVSVSSSGVQMEGEEFDWKPINQQGKTPFKNLTVTITDDKIKVLADDGFSSQSYTKDDIKDAMKKGEYLRFRGHNLELNSKMKAWANS